jgi:arabinogalactan endo-1,4-beta-galactosidase
MHRVILLLALLCFLRNIEAQSLFFGNDLSYVNEMEDCGVVYKEKGVPKDPYRIFADHGSNLVRLRLWHTPAWYDTLNAGKRYSDLQDVTKSILRAKSAGMAVLLDFHLSDTWADPGRQLIPKAWHTVANNLPVLQDSLYNYVLQTLLTLNRQNLLPELVQIGNETNREILLTEAQNAQNSPINWNRNSVLFKTAIKAVRDFQNFTGKNVQVALHIAGPEASDLVEKFWLYGVRDFDLIGLSYYWAWHQPTSIATTGAIIRQLRRKYPGKEVMIFETGYIWTTASNDQANNIINAVHPDYAPASPENQRKWCVDLTQEVINSGGKGVIYWEPAWVSSYCRTPWGQGSHQEHATFFDFNSNVLPNGGMGWMRHPFEFNTKVTAEKSPPRLKITLEHGHRSLTLQLNNAKTDTTQLQLLDSAGKIVVSQSFLPDATAPGFKIALPNLPGGIYVLQVSQQRQRWAVERVWLQQQ